MWGGVPEVRVQALSVPRSPTAILSLTRRFASTNFRKKQKENRMLPCSDSSSPNPDFRTDEMGWNPGSKKFFC